MTAMASQITSVSIACSTVCSGADQRKHQSPASLAFVREIQRWLVYSRHKGPVTRNKFPFEDVIISKQTLYMGQIMKPRLSCYLVLLPVGRKSRKQDGRTSMTYPILFYLHVLTHATVVLMWRHANRYLHYPHKSSSFIVHWNELCHCWGSTRASFYWDLTLKRLGHFFFQNVILFSSVVQQKCNIFIWKCSNELIV